MNLLKRVPSQQTIHNWVNKLRTGLLIDKKQKHKHRVLTEEKFDAIGPRLEHTPRKITEMSNPRNGVSKSSARMTIELLKLRPYKTTVIHARLATA
jgi:transposase